MREETIFKDTVAAKKEINLIPQVYPHVLSTLWEFQTKPEIKLVKNSRKIRESPSGTQQQQQQQQKQQQNRLNFARLQRQKNLKTRSITGETFEFIDNQVKDLVQPNSEIDKEDTLHIEPVLRVTSKKNIFESIKDIVTQLLYPQKDELGPVVGPIKVPGTTKKIYLRLLEPLDASHVMVRFVTQVAVPVAEADGKPPKSDSGGPLTLFPPVIDPAISLLNGHHSILPLDTVFDTSKRYQLLQPLRNVSFNNISNKKRSQYSPAKVPSKIPQGTNIKESFSPPKVLPGIPSEIDSSKDIFTHVDTQLKLEQRPDFSENVGEAASYLQSGDDAIRQVKELLNETGTLKDDDIWEEHLSTHRLPLRQVAPLYSLSSMEHSDHNSYGNTYSVPSDDLTVPNAYSNPYVRYNSTPEFYASSSNQHYSANPTSSSYSSSYKKQNNINSTPNTYSSSYQKQNDIYNVPNSYPNFYENQKDTYSAASSSSSSYSKSNISDSSDPHASSYSERNDALHIIEPPNFPGYHNQVMENRVNRSLEYNKVRQPRYNSRDFNEMSSTAKQNEKSHLDQTTWDKSNKKESTESFVSKRGNPLKIDTNYELWQPIASEKKDADWHKAFADLTKVSNSYHETKHTNVRNVSQSSNRPLKASRNTTDWTEKEIARRNSKRRGVVLTTVSTFKDSGEENEYEYASSTIRPVESTMKIIKKQTQPNTVMESETVITPTSVSHDEPEALKMDSTTESQETTTTTTMKTTTTMMTTMMTTMANNVTQKSLPLIKTTKLPVMNRTTQRPKLIMNRTTVNTTEKMMMNDTMEAFISSTTTRKPSLPKRPMIMKKPTFIMKRTESNNIVRSTTQRSITSTTKRSTTKRKPTYRSSKAQRTASSTT